MVQEGGRCGEGATSPGRARNRQGDGGSARARRRRASIDHRRRPARPSMSARCSAPSTEGAAAGAAAEPRRPRPRQLPRQAAAAAACAEPAAPRPTAQPLSPAVRKIVDRKQARSCGDCRHRQGRPRHQGRHARAQSPSPDCASADCRPAPTRAAARGPSPPTMPRAKSG